MRARPGHLAAALLALSSGVLWAGCGGGGHIAPLDRFDGAEPPSARERALAYARAVNLRASDFPYFKAMPEESHGDRRDEHRLDREIAECVGGGALSEEGDTLAKVPSSTYGTAGSAGLLTVQSEVEVVRDADVTARRSALYRNRHVRACLERVVGPALEEQGSAEAEIERVSIAWRSSPLPGLDWSFGYRIRASISSSGAAHLAAYAPASPPVSAAATVPLYLDLLAFHVGRGEISLVATGAPTPVSKLLERNLLRLLRDRAEALRP
jgi:hypothetical protein